MTARPARPDADRDRRGPGLPAGARRSSWTPPPVADFRQFPGVLHRGGPEPAAGRHVVGAWARTPAGRRQARRRRASPGAASPTSGPAARKGLRPGGGRPGRRARKRGRGGGSDRQPAWSLPSGSCQPPGVSPLARRGNGPARGARVVRDRPVGGPPLPRDAGGGSTVNGPASRRCERRAERWRRAPRGVGTVAAEAAASAAVREMPVGRPAWPAPASLPPAGGLAGGGRCERGPGLGGPASPARGARPGSRLGGECRLGPGAIGSVGYRAGDRRGPHRGRQARAGAAGGPPSRPATGSRSRSRSGRRGPTWRDWSGWGGAGRRSRARWVRRPFPAGFPALAAGAVVAVGGRPARSGPARPGADGAGRGRRAGGSPGSGASSTGTVLSRSCTSPVTASRIRA